MKNLSRILIAIPLFCNLLSAGQFILEPAASVSAFELQGVPGEVAVAGVGILFLMWNVPYLFALTNPVRNITSLLQACLMQAIGAIGESGLYFAYQLKANFPILAASIERYIIFDSIGLILLLLAYWIASKIK